MSFLNLTHETVLDLTVNLIPLGILAFMDVMFWVYNPWGWQEPLIIGVAHFLTLFPFAVLALLTYFSGTIVQRDEGQSPSAE